MKLTPILLLLVAAGCTALAGERAALLIGNAAYQKGTSLPALDTPPLDVAAMGQALREAQFDVTVEKDLTTAAMREKVVAFTRAHGDAEALLIYVSGHGVQVEGENYLPGVDANLDTTAAMANLSRAFPGMSAEEREGKERDVIRFTAGKQMVRLSVVLDALAATAQGDGHVRMIFLDTCRSPFRGAASKGMLGGKSGGGLAPVSERPGLFIGFAALANQEAQQNEAGHPSLFTEALAAQIRQPGLQLEQVFKRTSRAVTERSRTLKKQGVVSDEQTPAAYSVLQEDFVFVPEKVLANVPRPSFAPLTPNVPSTPFPSPVNSAPAPAPTARERGGGRQYILANETAQPFSGSLQGTIWDVRDSDGDRYFFKFGENGALFYDTGGAVRTGSWSLSRDAVKLSINSGFAELTGRIVSGHLKGTGKSKSGTWTWEATSR